MPASAPTLVYLEETPQNAWKVLIAAQFNGIKVNPKVYDQGADKVTMAANPWKRLPYLVRDEGVLANSNAIARFIAKMRPDGSMMGQSFRQSCLVESWMEFCTKELEIPAQLLLWAKSSLIQASEGQIQAAFSDISKSLDTVEKSLTGQFLVGSEVTLADISLVCALLEVYCTMLDANARKSWPKLEAWFDRCVALPQFQSVLSGKGLKKENAPAKGFAFAPAARSSGAAAPAAPAQKGWVKPDKSAKKEQGPGKAAPAAAPAATMTKGTPEDHQKLADAKNKVVDRK